VLHEASAVLGAGDKTSASLRGVRSAVEELVEQVAYGVESKGADVRQHRIGVSTLAVDGAAGEARLDRFVQAELLRGLRNRGFLVVERQQLAAAIDQAALGQLLDEQSAPQIGKVLGAQSMVVGRVSDAGARFSVALRVLDVETGTVVTGASSSLPREDVVSRAAVETRTPTEAAIRSALVPGWGQSYNGDATKAWVFGVSGYTALATTLGLGAGAAVTQATYDGLRPGPDLSVDQIGDKLVELRGLRDGLLIATAVAGGATVAVWGGGIVDALLGAPPE
jgi:hypothetical protein